MLHTTKVWSQRYNYFNYICNFRKPFTLRSYKQQFVVVMRRDSKPDYLTLTFGSATYYLYDHEQMISTFCTFSSCSVKWGHS